MAIQFPPINSGDPTPADGDTYLYLTTNTEYVYNASINAWDALGRNDSRPFEFRGSLEIKKPAPTADYGYIYSVSDGGLAAEIDASFTGLAGVYDVGQWSLVIKAQTDWLLYGTAATPWVRTSGGEIQPVIPTDNLDMRDGNYIITSLNELP